MQHRHHSRKVVDEIEVRLHTWRTDNPELRWTGVLERSPASAGCEGNGSEAGANERPTCDIRAISRS
jgi:hypothetical protein